MVWAFIPIAAVLTVTPGAATAMVVRSAMTGGWRAGIRVIAGNEVGVLVWAVLSVAGISALVAASEVVFVVLKIVGAAVLVWLGVQALRRAPEAGAPSVEAGAAWVEANAADADAVPPWPRRRRRPFRDGVITSVANPKLAVFFVALFPQFVGHRGAVLPTTLLMAALVIAFDFAWYSALAVAVGRAKRAFDRTRLSRALERISGAVLIALGIRVAIESH